VSSFGASGTNGHVIIEEAPPQSADEPNSETGAWRDGEARADSYEDVGALPWVLSGKGTPALRTQARRLLDRVEQDHDTSPADIGISLAEGRSALDHRAVVIGASSESLSGGLRSLARGEMDPVVIEGVSHGTDTTMAFLFTGQGAQRVGMGRELYGRFSVFGDALDEVCGHLDEHLGCSLREVMFGEGGNGTPSNSEPHLDETMFAQTSLFALELALSRLLEHFGLRPDYLLGHSIGELAAAHVSGVLALEDACALVAARGRLMGALPKGGAMVSIQASEQEAHESLVGFEQRVSLAAVNGPRAVVLSGDEDAVLELENLWSERGRKTKRLRVSHAFHSPRMEAMLDEYAQVAAGLTFTAPQIPIVSNVTGEVALAEQICDPAYWGRQVREPVRFYDGVRRLAAHRVSNLLELGPDGVLSAMSLDCISADEGVDEQSAPAPAHVNATSVLRGARPEVNALLAALAEVWVHGTTIDWGKLFAGIDARRVQLPTYPFQRRRYWLDNRASMGGGLMPALSSMGEHPILDGVVALAGNHGWLFTGHLSLDSQPWIGDHVVLGKVLVPGTTFVELALRVAEEVECEIVQELVMEAPLVLAGEGRVELQISVSELEDTGRRAIEIHSRPQASSRYEESDNGEWIRHASGMLAKDYDAAQQNGTTAGMASIAGAWPPKDAEPVAVEPVYDYLASVGVDYGSAFLTVKALWRNADGLFAEASLPEHELGRAGRFHIHPALFDAALHPCGAYAFASGQLEIPFAWSGVSVQRVGASSLRVWISQKSNGGISLAIMDDLGMPLATVQSLVARPVTAEQLESPDGRRQDSLSRVDWVTLALDRVPSSFSGALVCKTANPIEPLLSAAGSVDVHNDLSSLCETLQDGAEAPDIAVVPCVTSWLEADARKGADSDRDDAVRREPDEEMVEKMHSATHAVLEQVQAWLADVRLSGSRLAFVTRNAIAARSGDSVGGLEQAGVWGLVRSAAAENPRRLLLVDLDDDQSSWELLPKALRAASMLDEPQLAVREGKVLAPRLTPVDITDNEGSIEQSVAVAPGSLDLSGTVLITGGTGGLGVLMARHLVARHDARHLLLVSRSGREAEGALELAEELEQMGAQVSIEACDVTELDQLQALLSSVSPEYPLCAVVHVAGVLDDGVVDSLNAERVDRVLAPKAVGAWHLHRLTEHLNLSAFALFSSASGVLGGIGQGSYAAANTFLDALAAYRRAGGLAGISLAWGPWAASSGMLGDLDEVDRKRMKRSGVAPMSDAEALGLFDLACAQDEPLVLAARLDKRALSAWQTAEALPSMLRGFDRSSTRQLKGVENGALAKRLAIAPAHDHEHILLDAVRTHAAIVLGHASAEAVEETQSFKDLGFDSLAAVEMRNRLNLALGVSLPATLVFDYPTPRALSDYLRVSVAPDGAQANATVDDELDKLERLLASSASDETNRSRVAVRLQAILSGLDKNGNSHNDTGVAEKMHSATADEVLDFIDKELRSK
jgi:acyl transferase domain-containing protein/acyl carrier protein